MKVQNYNPSTQKEDLSKLKTSIVYTVNSKPTRATQQDLS